MIKIIKADGVCEKNALREIEARNADTDAKVSETVAEILRNVRMNGDSAVEKYSIKFDGGFPEKLELNREDMKAAVAQCDEKFIKAVKKAAKNIEDFHARQKQQSWFTTDENGVFLGQRVRGLKRVGIYVPGGTAAYPSSVLMNAIPAKIAGVKEIIMVTPPGKNGVPNPDILAAAYIAGVDKIFQIGGAQAIAALSYGTKSVPRVEKIVGPGNIFVATAKKLVFGTVDIDMVAGPSEILIVADESANPKFLAADLLSQAEHDKLASAILITTSEKIANDTVHEVEVQLNELSRVDIARESVDNFGLIICCDTADYAMQLANDLAPEHLEICLENPMSYIEKADNAGSVFLGNYSPEPLGDYFAGPNHVLPTGGTARFFSPLSVDGFVKKISIINYSEEALKKCADDVIIMAQREGLDAHANAIKVRK